MPVGGVELPEAETEEAAEEEDTVAEPTYAFAQGFGRFVIRYTWLATALGWKNSGIPIISAWLYTSAFGV